MSNDFISRSELKEMLLSYGCLDAAALLDDFPTAYDVDRVAEQLENSAYWTESTFDGDGYSNDDSEEVIELQKAIEIVKEGGVDA